MIGHSLLAIFAHPDDESIACGGLLARCADMGVRVSLVCVTRGEDGPQPEAPAGQELREVRSRELEAAARVLGVDELIVLDYPDGYLPWVDAVELTDRLTGLVRRIAPDVVVTFGDDGLYWHPDHIALHERTTAAVASLGDEAPALYYVTLPPGLMRRLCDELAQSGARPEPILGIDDPDAFGSSAQAPTLTIDVGPWAARKAAALRCHHTQVDGGVLARISDQDARRLLGVETFHRSAVGAAGDVFLEQMAVR